MSNRAIKAALVAALVAMLLVPAAASAQDAGALLAEGLVRLRLGKFRQALKVLKRARSKTSDPTTKAQIHLNMGVVYMVLRKRRKARRQFATAMHLELPVGKYAVQVVSPDGLYRLEAEVVVRSDEVSQVKGSLQLVGFKLEVTSRPGKARVQLDGKKVGVTPLSTRVAAGEHLIRITKRGFTPHESRIKGMKGGTVAVSVTLKPPVPKPTTQPATAPAPPPPPPEPKRRFPMWSVITAGAALAAAGAGIGLGLATRSTYEDYEQATRQSEYWDLRDQVTTLQTAANASFIAAGTLALGAAAVWERHRVVTEAPAPAEGKSPREAPAASWRVMPSPGGLTVQF